MPPFSARSRFDLRKNVLSLAIEQARASGAVVLDLTVGNPTEVGFASPSRVARALARRASSRYDPAAFGLTTARRQVRAHLAERGTDVPLERVLLTASTSEAYGFLFELLCDPSDDVLVGLPGYPLLDHLARLHDVRLTPYRLAYDGTWHVDHASLEQAISERTRAIVLVHPNNPTGSFVSRADMARIETLAASRGLAIVSDEVFYDYRYPGSGVGPDGPADSAARLRHALSFALGGLSKSAGLPQMKLGWIVLGGPDALVSEAIARLEVITDASLSVGAPVQHALPALLRSGARTRARISKRVIENRARVAEAVAGTSITLLSSEGGWYAVLRVPATQTDEAWALELLREESVLVQPGYLFDFATDGHLVLSLLCRPDLMREALVRLVRRIG